MQDRATPTPPVARRPSAETRRPYHVGVALGLTASVYAGSLAAVSLLQIERDRGLIADRQPVSDAIVMLGRHHDEMASSLGQAGTVFEEASKRYDKVAADYQKLHIALVSLGRKLQAIDALTAVDGSGLGSTYVSSGGGKLPTVAKTTAKSGGTTSAPATGATTGASGAP